MMTATSAPPVTASRLDVDTLLALSRDADPVGVLSIYVDARPGKGRTAAIEINNRLAELQHRLADDGPRDQARAVQERMVQLVPDIAQLIDPEEPGRGRVLFAAISDSWTTRLPTQLPLPNRVVLDHSAFIHPLLEAFDEGRRAGVVLASRNHARLLEWHLGALVPLRRLTGEVIARPHERSGPIGSRPGSRHGTPTGEQRRARDREHTVRFIADVAAVASKLADERGWERLLIGGGPQLTDALVRALPAVVRESVVRDPRVLAPLHGASLSDAVTDTLRAAHHESEQRLTHTLREQAHGSSHAALGQSQVVGALNQARVAHLVYDPEVRYQGSVDSDGRLYADQETAPARACVHEPRLTERIVERALETGARVTPIEGAASDGLAQASGIAAVLRW